MFGRQDNHNTDNTSVDHTTAQPPSEPVTSNSLFGKGLDSSTDNQSPTPISTPVVEPSTAPVPEITALPPSSSSTLDDLSPKDNDEHSVPKFSPSNDVTIGDTPADDDLLSLKQQALQQLTPLVGHLDQTPEEKFRTTMMMIQGADNQSLIKDAYQAAQQISDEKLKAQALLDIVNEINYFTHKHESESS